MSNKLLSQKNVEKVFSRFQELNPSPKGELEYVNVYTLLVAVVLSAQATDVGVNKATRSLFKKVKTPEAMLELGLEGLKDKIKTIGLYNSKAKNIIALSEQLIKDHKGEVPDAFEELIKLPGVGRKTANVVLSIAFQQPTIAVDTHLFRVSRRLGLSKGKTPLDVEHDLMKVIPAPYRIHAHHWLILHGRYICKARKPLCFKCPVSDICPYPEKTMVP